MTRKLLHKATPQSVDDFFGKVTAIPVPQWHVSPHLHKQSVDNQIWEAAELLVLPKHVPRKIFANEKIVELSVTRMWHLRRKTTLRRLLRRFALRRFFDAWLAKNTPELHLGHLLPPGELGLWYEMVWHTIQLIATLPVQKQQVQRERFKRQWQWNSKPLALTLQTRRFPSWVACVLHPPISDYLIIAYND